MPRKLSMLIQVERYLDSFLNAFKVLVVSTPYLKDTSLK
jgi:hypothetical protein